MADNGAERVRLEALLEPLLGALGRANWLRLVARPGAVEGDRPEGTGSLDLAWTQAQHDAAQTALATPRTLSAGVVAFMLGNTLVLKKPPDTVWRVDDLVRQGWLSSLAGRTLVAAVGLGRNVLITGPWAASVQLCASLVSEGRRPALLGSVSDAVPTRWPCVAQASQVAELGADRVASWSLSAGDLAAAMGALSGVVGWLDGRRLDRVLMRFEAGIEQRGNRASTPLHVLAGLDLVVVLSDFGAPRLREVAEIVLTSDGYRPSILFASGLAPAPTALVPVGLPTFIDAMAHAGDAVLAEELRHAVPGARSAPSAASRPLPAQAPVAAEKAAVVPAARAPRPRATARPPDGGDVPASEPGWELDRLLPDTVDDLPIAPSTVEEATLAATYGLGPPPRPAGVKGLAPSFSQALEHAQERQQTASVEDSSEPE